MFGQLAVLPPAPWFGRVVGGVAGVDGSVVLGADEAAGAGLAAETAATAPPMMRSAASDEVSTVRRRPECLDWRAAGTGPEADGPGGGRRAGATGVMGAGTP